MKINDFVRVISRLLAIYVVIRIVDMMQIMIPPILQVENAMQYFPIISILLYIMLFLVLWFWSDWIAKAIVGNSDATLDKGNITAVQIQSILFSVVGVFILAGVIPQLVQLILANMIVDSSNASIYGSMIDFGIKDIALTRSMIPQLVGLGLKFIIGLWLLLGAKSLVGFFNRGKQVVE